MASFFSSVRQGFGRQSNRSPNSSAHPQNDRNTGQQAPSPAFQAQVTSTNWNPPSSTSPIPPSPGVAAANMSLPENSMGIQAQTPIRPPYFFRDEYSGLIVKGNFMTLAAKPVHVEEGEWLAHQVVEQYRLLDLMIQIIRVVDEKTGLPVCNPEVCPTMSASGHTYTWLDNQRRPIRIPACQYIQLVQKWILGKISDPALFPTDTTSPTMYTGGQNNSGTNTPIPAGPTNLSTSLNTLSGRDWLGKSSGFPENFEIDIRSIYRQMMRCYAHLYHGHWIDPFWHINAYKELNTCFVHFVNVGKLFNLIGDKEMEPMQPLIDLWLAKGLLPAAQQSQSQSQQSNRMDTSGSMQGGPMLNPNALG